MPEVVGRLRTPRLPSAPATPVVGEMYYDTALNKLYWWNGTIWVAASGSAEVYEQTTTPSSTNVGALWIDTDDVPPAWASLVPTATVLPTNPVDGQEVYFIADATNGVIWHLRYNAGSASAYRWEYIGGPSLKAAVGAQETLAGATNTWYDPTTPGPSVTVPLAGDYDINFGAAPNHGIASLAYYFNVGVAIGAANPITANLLTRWGPRSSSVSTTGVAIAGSLRLTALTALTALKLKYLAVFEDSLTHAFAVQQRWIDVKPVRVG